MCAFDVPAAHAGHWEVVPRSETGELNTGTVSFVFSWQDDPDDDPDLYTDEYPVSSGTTHDGKASGGGGGSFDAVGGPGEVSAEGLKFKLKLRYVPDNEDDVAQGPVYIKVVLVAYADVTDDDGSSYRDASKEHVSATVTPPGNIVSGSLILNDMSYAGTAKAERRTATFYVKVEPEDAANPIDIGGASAKASLDGDRFGGGAPLIGVGAALAHFTGEIKDIRLSISSDIEPSWKKHEGELPDKYKKWIIDADGQRVFGPDPSKARLVAKDFFGTNDIWAVVCSPTGNAMTVESAAQWKGTQWMGSAQFNAIHRDFDAPTFTWAKPSGAIGGNTASSSLDLTITGDGRGHFIRGINLGGDKFGNLSNSSSTVALLVSDSFVGLNSEYTVNWHLPVEDETEGHVEPRATHELRSPDDFRDGDVALEPGSHLNATFRLGGPWYLQDAITGVGKGFQGGANIGGDDRVAFLLEKIGELIESYDLGAEQSTNCPFTADVWNRSSEMGLVPNGASITECKMVYPYVVFYYDLHNWSYDTYGVNGYFDREAKTIRKPTSDSPLYAGRFERKSRSGEESPNG